MSYFNSHAHVERDSLNFINFVKIAFISTHTLTWSVTVKMFIYNVQILISTHTLTWSVTYDEEIENDKENISTHTLTWSVT